MKHLIFIILFIVVTIQCSFAQSFEWAKSFGGISDEFAYSIAIDSSGNVYTIGYFAGSVDFDPGIGTFLMNSGSGEDMFIQKLDAQGNFIWAKQIGGVSYAYGNSISVDEIGNIYISGNFLGTADFDPGSGIFNMTSAGNYDIFIQKLNSNGDFIWAKQMGGSMVDGITNITIDKAGNIYSTGSFEANCDFDPGTATYNLTSTGFRDIFYQKLDSNGNFVWAKRIGGVYHDIANSIIVDVSGNLYTTGYFEQTVDFDPGSGTSNLISKGSYDIFIQKIDSSGNFIWAKGMGSTKGDIAYSIALDYNNNVYTTGYFSDTVDFDPGNSLYNIISTGFRDIYIQKLDSNGNFVWVKQVGGIDGEEARDVTIDKYGKIYLTGYFAGTVDFDPGIGIHNKTVVIGGSSDIFILKLDSNGNFNWASQTGANSNESGISLAVDLSGYVYTTGYFDGIVDFNPGIGTYNLTSVGNRDVFIQKLNQNIVGLNEVILDDASQLLKIYPNPNKGIFTLEININSNITKTYQLEVINSLGKLIHQENVTFNSTYKNQMNLNALNKGFYFFRLSNEDKVLYKRFVIE